MLVDAPPNGPVLKPGDFIKSKLHDDDVELEVVKIDSELVWYRRLDGRESIMGVLWILGNRLFPGGSCTVGKEYHAYLDRKRLTVSSS